MRRLHHSMVCVLPSLAGLLLSLSGCGQEEVRHKRPRATDEEEKPPVELKASSFGTISGKVVLDDGFNPPAAQVQPMGNQEGQCHSDSFLKIDDKDWKTKPVWIIGPNRGVKNVVVFLQPPDGQFFFVPEDQRKPKDVDLEQPHCTFYPRVFTLFPGYYDAKTESHLPTGQVLHIKSSPSVAHNYKVQGAGVKVNNALGAGAKEATIVAKADLQAQMISVQCDIHGWMQAYGFVLDHPFAAITDDKGEFKIEKAPLGVKLQVVAWYEAASGPKGFFLRGGEDGDPMELTANQAFEFKVKGR
jgi:hypothetical protein